MVVKTKLSKDTISLLENGSIVEEGDGIKYYFLPFWFKKIGDTNEFEIHSLGKLPKKLQDLIISKRNEQWQKKK